MSFALAGQIITQSGTDTDATTISGLSAIAGVTTIAESGHTRLIIPYRFDVNGLLSNTALTAFTFSRVRTAARVNEVTINGRWNYKQSRTFNGLTDWRIMPPMIFTQAISSENFNSTIENLIYVQGGIQDFAKVELIGNGGYYWNGGTIIFRDVTINAEGLSPGNDQQITTQAGNPTIDIDGLEFRGGKMFIRSANIVQLKRLKPKFVSRGFGTGFGLSRTLEDFDCVGATYDISIYGGGSSGVIRCNNPVKGGGVTCGPWSDGGGSGPNNEYYCTSDLVLTSVNELGAPVLFKAYHLDNNTGAPVGAGLTSTNYALRKTYNVLSSAAGVATLNLLLSAGLYDIQAVRRSASQIDDLFAFNCFSYLSQPTVTPSINLTGAGAKSATVVQLRDFSISQVDKATVDAYTTLDTLDRVYDRAKAFLFNNFSGETSPLIIGDGTTLNAGTKNIILDGGAATAFAFNSGTNTLTIKATSLTAGTKFKTLLTTGSITVAAGSVVSGVGIDGNVTQATPTDLTNVTITGALTYNRATATPVTFTGVSAGSVVNSGAGIVTVKLVNSTATAGANVVTFKPTNLVFALNGGRIRVLNNVGVEQFNQSADGTFELPAAATGTWTYSIRKYGSQEVVGAIVIDGTIKTIAPAYIPDTKVVDALVNVSTYTELNSTQKIYDYLAYFGTTALGIVSGVVASKGFGTLTVPAGLVTDPSAGAIISVVSGVVTSKTASINEAVTIISNGVVTTGATVISAAVAIRASNLDSELVYTPDSLTFYPTSLDQSNGTNAGATISGGLYRFKYGATVSGVVLATSAFVRATTGGVTSFASIPLATGRNVLDTGVQTRLDSIIQSIKPLARRTDVLASRK